MVSQSVRYSPAVTCWYIMHKMRASDVLWSSVTGRIISIGNESGFSPRDHEKLCWIGICIYACKCAIGWVSYCWLAGTSDSANGLVRSPPVHYFVVDSMNVKPFSILIGIRSIWQPWKISHRFDVTAVAGDGHVDLTEHCPTCVGSHYWKFKNSGTPVYFIVKKSGVWPKRRIEIQNL